MKNWIKLLIATMLEVLPPVLPQRAVFSRPPMHILEPQHFFTKCTCPEVPYLTIFGMTDVCFWAIEQNEMFWCWAGMS